MKKIFILLSVILPMSAYATVTCNELVGTVYCTGTDGAGNDVNIHVNDLVGTTYTTGTSCATWKNSTQSRY